MNSPKLAPRTTPPATPHTWTRTPNMIYADFRYMETAELRCTLVLIRETYGYHRQATNLTYDDFLRLTTIKSTATIAAGLKAVEKRGYFKRGGPRSQWAISSQFETNDSPNASDIEANHTANASQIKANETANASEIEANDAPNSSKFEPFHYNKERSPSGKERESERKPPPAIRPAAAVAGSLDHTARHPMMPWPESAEEIKLAAHPATKAWLDSGAAWPGWQRLELITQRLGPAPQGEALKKARDLWLMAGYRMANINGVLDWYEAICHDPHWQPYGKPSGKGNGRTPQSLDGPRDPTMEMLLRLKTESTCT